MADLRIELRELGSAGLIVFFQQSKRFADNLAGRIVAPGLNFGAHELFKLGGSDTFIAVLLSVLYWQ